jgi:hypothetical protein
VLRGKSDVTLKGKVLFEAFFDMVSITVLDKLGSETKVD